MAEESKPFLNFQVDDEANPQRITHIRNTELPKGILYTPPDVAQETRTLSPEAVRTVTAAFQWARDMRRDAGRD